MTLGATAASAQYGPGYDRGGPGYDRRSDDRDLRPAPPPAYHRDGYGPPMDRDRPPPPPRPGYGPPPPPPGYGDYRPQPRRCYVERTPYGPREVCRRGPPRW